MLPVSWCPVSSIVEFMFSCWSYDACIVYPAVQLWPKRVWISRILQEAWFQVFWNELDPLLKICLKSSPRDLSSMWRQLLYGVEMAWGSNGGSWLVVSRMPIMYSFVYGLLLMPRDLLFHTYEPLDLVMFYLSKPGVSNLHHFSPALSIWDLFWLANVLMCCSRMYELWV